MRTCTYAIKRDKYNVENYFADSARVYEEKFLFLSIKQRFLRGL